MRVWLVILATGVALLAGCGDGAAEPATSSATTSSTSSATAGNGVAALEPAAIVARARAAIGGVASFRMKATYRSAGQPTTLDYEISGANMLGTAVDGHGRIRKLMVGGERYVKPDAAYWRTALGKRADTVVKAVGARWVRVPAGNKAYASWFPRSPAAEATQMLQLMADGGEVTKAGMATIDGRPVISLVNHGVGGGRLYVATVGEPYPLRLDDPTDTGVGFEYSAFGAVFPDITVPPATDVVDLAKLGL
jgi:hypothetical protein